VGANHSINQLAIVSELVDFSLHFCRKHTSVDDEESTALQFDKAHLVPDVCERSHSEIHAQVVKALAHLTQELEVTHVQQILKLK